MNLKNLPPWTQLVVALVLMGALVGSQFFFAPGAFNEKRKQIAKLGEELNGLKAEIRKAEQTKLRMLELKREIASLEQKLNELKQILPTAPEMGDLLKWIKSLSDQTNLELQAFSPQNPEEKEFLREHPVSMEVVGNYHQLGLFFDRISKYARIINVENVQISKNEDRLLKATIKASFLAKTYMFREEAEPQNEAPRKKGGA